MRVEVACNRLISASFKKDISSDELAKTMSDALEKVKEQSVVGPEALDKLHSGFLREALKNPVNVRKLMALKNEVAAEKKSSARKPAVAKKASRKSAAKVARKSTSKTSKSKTTKRARPKSNASENRAAA